MPSRGSARKLALERPGRPRRGPPFHTRGRADVLSNGGLAEGDTASPGAARNLTSRSETGPATSPPHLREASAGRDRSQRSLRLRRFEGACRAPPSAALASRRRRHGKPSRLRRPNGDCSFACNEHSERAHSECCNARNPELARIEPRLLRVPRCDSGGPSVSPFPALLVIVRNAGDAPTCRDERLVSHIA
jgi:hypothetical protein